MNGASQDPMEEIFAMFRAESREHVNRITELLLALERGEVEEAELEELFRAAHSLKGSASTLGVNRVAEIAHAIEDVFGAVKRGEFGYDEKANTEILTALYAISALVEEAKPGQEEEDAPVPVEAARVLCLLGADSRPEPPPSRAEVEDVTETEARTADAEAAVEAPKPDAGAARATGETLRLPVAKLDAVIDGFSEMWEEKFRNDEFGVRFHGVALSARAANKILYEAVETYRRRGDREEFLHQVEKAAEVFGSVDREMRAIDFSYAGAAKRFELDLAGFGDELGRLRMAPLRELFRGFRRPMRDLAVRLGKKVRLDIIGEDNELDKTIIELIKDPLNHILRNAVDHGIEDEEARRGAGKPPAGRILIASTRVGSRLLIEVEDDGCGINLERVKKVAVAAGVIRAEAADGLGADEVARLIFEPGVTTKKKITEVGGRGVGLDVVVANVAALGGTVDVWTESGVGSRFTIQLPLTIATARGLLVKAGKAEFIVPSSAIKRVDVAPAGDFETVEGRPVLRYDGRVVAAGELGAILGTGDNGGSGAGSAVLILSSPSGDAALVVSDVGGEGEFLTKDLGPIGAQMPYFGAAHVTGKGEVVLILNADVLVREIIRGEVVTRAAAVTTREARKRTILVVDDSLTTRALEKNILEAAGYSVAIASDGREALEVLADVPCDLAVVDLQMPRMDGYELTRHIRASADYRDLPVVVVTSLETDKDMARGLEAGADAYIKKSHFDQRELLSIIEQFI
jgi:two-component system chemotaxis sensor kinase CheA